MARVAENQDRAEQMRTAFVYEQNVLVRMQRYNGKLTREEYSEFTVTPTAQGIQKTRTQFRGKYADHGKTVNYDKPGFQYKGLDIDGEVAHDLVDDLTADRKSKDGIAHDLFPLTAKEQRKYEFHLEAEQEYRGMQVYRISFAAKKDQDDGGWAGEALIDRQEYQPVLVTTHLAAKIPLLVRTMLGTNLEHLGFKVTYKKFDTGLWFPVTYGGEFKVRALFLYARRVGVSLQNSGFQHADVSSAVRFDTFSSEK
ncbi:MAG: hypothetical protein M3Z32_06200 [Acidobacteriota bacterium]|nr:hypothetical protein [Acidobacteriota bacterium]